MNSRTSFSLRRQVSSSSSNSSGEEKRRKAPAHSFLLPIDQRAEPTPLEAQRDAGIITAQSDSGGKMAAILQSGLERGNPGVPAPSRQPTLIDEHMCDGVPACRGKNCSVGKERGICMVCNRALIADSL